MNEAGGHKWSRWSETNQHAHPYQAYPMPGSNRALPTVLSVKLSCSFTHSAPAPPPPLPSPAEHQCALALCRNLGNQGQQPVAVIWDIGQLTQLDKRVSSR